LSVVFSRPYIEESSNKVMERLDEDEALGTVLANIYRLLKLARLEQTDGLESAAEHLNEKRFYTRPAIRVG
uniref:Phosphoenolpyruvate carboxylase n=1 Tax=Schistocephalus solidus TaxID=70667 RepID=A0A183S927_SCHSO